MNCGNNGQPLPYESRRKTVILNDGSPDSKRQEILEYFLQTYEIYEHLFELLANEDAYRVRGDRLRQPLIFYFGHTAVFYVNKLNVMRVNQKRINPRFESILAIGVDEMSYDDLDEAHYEWPTSAEVREYRAQVKELVVDVIKNMTIKIPIGWDDNAWLVLMGIEHEQCHLETSTVLIRQLPMRFVKENGWPVCEETGAAPVNELVKVAEGRVSLGKAHDADTYGWDNEYGTTDYDLDEFAASKYLVSNEEYLAFVQDSGYTNARWWTEEGWRWRCFSKLTMPIFWRKIGGDYWLRLMAREIPMAWNWPVEINYLEAKAFCNWKSTRDSECIRLPTEAEFYRMLDVAELAEKYPDWKKAPANIDLAYYASACPVDKFNHGDFYDLIGNVWQWTETHFYAFDGFRVHPGYMDFSEPYFEGLHNLMKGGSWISMGNCALTSYRAGFRRHFMQQAGFRYVSSEANTVNMASHELVREGDIRDMRNLLSEYYEFHFGQPRIVEYNYCKEIVRLALNAMGNAPRCRALDLGCATGRGAFELARTFKQVIGLDFNSSFVRAAWELQQEGRACYSLRDEAELVRQCEVRLCDLGLSAKQLARVEFMQGDACNLAPIYDNFDLIIAARLIDQLYDPPAFLHTVHERLVPGGILAISSGYNWSMERTVKDKWLGGYNADDKKPLATMQALHQILEDHFEPIDEPRDVLCVMHHSSRVFHYVITQLTLWKRVE